MCASVCGCSTTDRVTRMQLQQGGLAPSVGRRHWGCQGICWKGEHIFHGDLCSGVYERGLRSIIYGSFSDPFYDRNTFKVHREHQSRKKLCSSDIDDISFLNNVYIKKMGSNSVFLFYSFQYKVFWKHINRYPTKESTWMLDFFVIFGYSVSQKVVKPTSLTFSLGLVFPQNSSGKRTRLAGILFFFHFKKLNYCCLTFCTNFFYQMNTYRKILILFLFLHFTKFVFKKQFLYTNFFTSERSHKENHILSHLFSFLIWLLRISISFYFLFNFIVAGRHTVFNS